MANTKPTSHRRLDNLLGEKANSLKELANLSSASSNPTFMHASVKLAKAELATIEKELSPLYAQLAIANKLKEGFSRQTEVDISRVFNDNSLGELAHPHFPNPANFKSERAVGSFEEVEAYLKWLIDQIYPLIFDEKGHFLTPYEDIFKESKFERYNDKPGKLKIEILKSILVCIVPQNSDIETHIKLGMQNNLFKNTDDIFNAPEAYNLKALKEYLDGHFKKPETKETFDALAQQCSSHITDHNQTETNNHIEKLTSQDQAGLAHSKLPTDKPKKSFSTFLIKALHYLSLPARFTYAVIKMGASYFQRSDLGGYNPEKGWVDPPSTPSKPSQPRFSFSFYSTDEKKPKAPDYPQSSTSYASGA